MSLYITHRAGTVHGGENLCCTARQAVLMSRHRQVRLSQVVVYKLARCTECFTARHWEALMSNTAGVST